MAPAYEPSAVSGSTASSRDSAMNCASSPRKNSRARRIVEGERGERIEHAVLAGDAAVEGFDADDGDHVLGRDAGFLVRLLEPRAVLEHELRAFGDALLGEEALAVLPPGRDLLGGLADQLDDLRLRLGLGEQAVDVERLPSCCAAAVASTNRLDFGAIEIETGATGERAVRECGTRSNRRNAAMQCVSVCGASRGNELPMRVEGHQDTEARQQGHHRCAAVTDQRQRHTDNRQQAADHAGIDEHVNEEGERDAAGQQTRERVLRFTARYRARPTTNR